MNGAGGLCYVFSKTTCFLWHVCYANIRNLWAKFDFLDAAMNWQQWPKNIGDVYSASYQVVEKHTVWFYFKVGLSSTSWLDFYSCRCTQGQQIDLWAWAEWKEAGYMCIHTGMCVCCWCACVCGSVEWKASVYVHGNVEILRTYLCRGIANPWTNGRLGVRSHMWE